MSTNRPARSRRRTASAADEPVADPAALTHPAEQATEAAEPAATDQQGGSPEPPSPVVATPQPDFSSGGSVEATASDQTAEIAEYADLSYRDQFWPVRQYEDQVDRVAIRAFLPPSGDAILDLGAGFGRLADEYLAYHRVVLFDASETLLAAAREQLGGDERIEFVHGDARDLPFADATFDAATCIRVFVHVRDPRSVLAELARVVKPGGTVVVEFANRRHLLAVARRLVRRQDWSPFDPGPHEYRPMHFAHQPTTIRRIATAAGFRVTGERTVSLFRTPAISRRVPVQALVRVERPLQRLLGPFRPGPSTYLRLVRR